MRTKSSSAKPSNSRAGQLEAMKVGRLLGLRSRLSLLEQNEVIELVVAKMPVQAVAETYGMSQSCIKEIYSVGIVHKRRY
jgi:hypothetical protein